MRGIKQEIFLKQFFYFITYIKRICIDELNVRELLEKQLISFASYQCLNENNSLVSNHLLQ